MAKCTLAIQLVGYSDSSETGCEPICLRNTQLKKKVHVRRANYSEAEPTGGPPHPPPSSFFPSPLPPQA